MEQAILSSPKFNIKSTSNPNDIKKIILNKERFLRSTGKPKSEIRTFNLTNEDLKRRFILNIFNGSENTDRVSSATIKVNGKLYAKQNDFNQNVSDISFNIDNFVSGINTLEVQLSSKPNSSIDISIEGFLESLSIPEAIHSRIPDSLIDDNNYVKGNINIKFLEGMKVRLVEENGKKKLKDLNGTSIKSLEDILNNQLVEDVYKSIDLTYEELDEEERIAEEFLGKEVPSMGLFYTFKLKDKETDVWKIIDKIKKLPYIEESYPDFIGQTPDLPSNNKFNTKAIGIPPTGGFPDDPIINYSDSFYDGSQWLKVTHIMGNDKDNGLWSITKGSPNIASAIIDTGGIDSHEDLRTDNYEYVDNTDKYDILLNTPINFIESSQHGVNSSSVLGSSKTNNGIGTGGVAVNNRIINIKAFSSIYGSLRDARQGDKGINISNISLCKGSNNIKNKCNQEIDSIILARKKGAKVIVIERQYKESTETIEKAIPLARTLIAGSVSKGIVMIVPAGNQGNTDISKIRINGIDYQMPDTGSIIVGGLKINGSSRFNIKGDPKGFNYGKSQIEGLSELYTLGGHGVDICAPAENVSSMSLYNDHSSFRFPELTEYTNYTYEFGGTSAGSPIIGGISALLLSLKPNASPLEIRRALRKSEQRNLLDSNSQDTAGMVNAYKAYQELNLIPNENNRAEGLIAKFYANTVYLRPETIVANREHKPFAVKIYPNNRIGYDTINFTGLNPYITSNITEPYGTWNDTFRAGLKDFFVADFQGEIKIPVSGYYSFIVGHDDGAILEIDDNVVIDANYPTPFRYEYSSNIYLEEGYHKIRLMFSEITREAALNLFWRKPDGTTEYITKSNLYHNISDEYPSTYQAEIKPKIIGRFFDFSYRNIINPPFQNVSNQTPLALYPDNSGIYNNLNFSNLTDFNMPYSGNFVGFFSGFIKLPSNYQSGNYFITIRHDDGVSFYFDGEHKIEDIRGTSAVEHTTLVNLNNNVYYPFVLTYDQRGGNAELKLYWQRQGSNQKELIPENALFHCCTQENTITF